MQNRILLSGGIPAVKSMQIVLTGEIRKELRAIRSLGQFQAW